MGRHLANIDLKMKNSMKNRKVYLLLIFVLAIFRISITNAQINDTQSIINHPRILLTEGEKEDLIRGISGDKFYTDIHNMILSECDKILDYPLNQRAKVGWRLIDISRSNLERIFFLSYAYRMTNKIEYAQRAEQEMLNAAKFKDWNPSHFLDVAEMCLGVAIGYDWLYDTLSESSRKIIEDAIIEKALLPSFEKKYSFFVDATHNWNQVCHTGLAYGALAIWERNKALSIEVLNRAIQKLPISMKPYAPDGAYPEGCIYWGYGTTYNVLLISLLDTIFNDDFGLSQLDGFSKSGEYMVHLQTPKLTNFTYSDNYDDGFCSPAMYWFAQKNNDLSILYNQEKLYHKYGMGELRRVAPALLIWGREINSKGITPPQKILWSGNGVNPVAMLRSKWGDEDAIFMGVKLGSPSVNHGHMDVGSFTIQSQGVDWALDLGREDYTKLEKWGVDLWNMSPKSQRWDIFRYNNFCHNTLSYNKKMQIVAGYAKVDSVGSLDGNSFVVSDLSELYSDQVKSSKRAFSLIDNKLIVIEDCVTTHKNYAQLSWVMLSEADVCVVSDNMLQLSKDGKIRYLTIDSPNPIRWVISSADPHFPFDSPNRGVTKIEALIDLAPHSTTTITATFSQTKKNKNNYKSHFLND